MIISGSRKHTFSEITAKSAVEKKSESPIVGASAGEEVTRGYGRVLGGIADTQKKLPSGTTWTVTPAMHEEAFDIDTLTSGIITPFLKNVLLGNYNTETADNKKYAAMIKDFQSEPNPVSLSKEI